MERKETEEIIVNADHLLTLHWQLHVSHACTGCIHALVLSKAMLCFKKNCQNTEVGTCMHEQPMTMWYYIHWL